MSFTVPEIPGVVEHLRLPGVRGRIGPTPHPAASVVGQARLSEADAPRTIEAVLRLYAERGRGFNWVVTPLSRPGEGRLDRALRDAGFRPGPPSASLVHVEPGSIEVPVLPGVALRLAAPEDRDALVGLMAGGFGLPVDTARFGVSVALDPTVRKETEVHLAVDERDRRIVGFGYLTRLEVRPVEGLGGAVVAASHRGRGVYRALTASRLAAAGRRGAPAVVVQAMRESSAPTLFRAGFREIGPVERYAAP